MNKTIWRGIIAVLGLAIVAMIGWSMAKPKEKTEAVVPSKGNAEVIVQEKVVENRVEVEREISAEIIEEGLRDMGFLVTQEYYFTEVAYFSKSSTKWFICKAESSYTGSYDGVITAGIDFTQIRVSKDEANKTIRVTIPEAQIQNVTVDPESFVVYEERNTWGSHVNVEEFNETLIALQTNAKKKAIDRGLLEKADENAQTLIRNFVASMFDPGEYSIVITSQS